MAIAEPKNYGRTIISWPVPEYQAHERGKTWYIVAITIALLLLTFAFLTFNYLFAVIIVIAALVIFMHDKESPGKVKISLTEEGVIVGRKFHDYDVFKNFAVIDKPHRDVKNLYLEYKNSIRPRLSLPLGPIDALTIRKIILKYLPEDLDRTDESLSEAIGRILKL